MVHTANTTPCLQRRRLQNRACRCKAPDRLQAGSYKLDMESQRIPMACRQALQIGDELLNRLRHRLGLVAVR